MPVRLLRLSSLLAALSWSFATCSLAEDLANLRCPVRPDEAALSRFQSAYDGKTVYFCCRDCITTFEEDPDSYLSALPQFADRDRPTWRQPFDRAWNAGLRHPGLPLGILALLAFAVGRIGLALPDLRAWPQRAFAAAASLKTLGTLAVLAIAAEAVVAHRGRLVAEKQLTEMEREDWLHFATFRDYGDPPLPAPPEHSPRLEITYYRGNDERSELLYNGGFYLTASFDLSLCRADGIALHHGDPAPSPDELFLRILVTRAQGTPDYFWTPERMGHMFATREGGRFLGRSEPVADATPLRTVKPMRRWEIRYPLSRFVSAESLSERHAGILYVCENRYDEAGILLGARFHYAIPFDLDFADGTIQPASSLWMGSLYRSRTLRIWQIPAREWLSTDPIPEIEGGHLTEDPEILGITGHVEDRN